MRRFLNQVLIGSGLLLMGVTANAQIYRDDPYYRSGPYRDDPNYGGYRDDGYYRNDGYRNGGYGNSGGALLDQVRADLDNASYRSRNGGDMRHFDHARRELDKFTSKWSQGRWDEGPLNETISELEHLANNSHLRGRERDALAQDMYALRDFRSSKGYGGYQSGGYGNYGGYRNDPYNRGRYRY